MCGIDYKSKSTEWVRDMPFIIDGGWLKAPTNFTNIRRCGMSLKYKLCRLPPTSTSRDNKWPVSKIKVWDQILINRVADLLIPLCDQFCHLMRVTRKQTLRSLSLSYQKKDAVAAPILLLVWHQLFEDIIYDVSRVEFWKVGVIPNEGWALPWQQQRS